MIALCPNCHRRHHRGEIDKGSLRIYKANLSVVNSRYSDYERRVLDMFAERPDADTISLSGADFHLLYLLSDCLLEDIGPGGVSILAGGTELAPKRYRLTDRGREFVDRWRRGEDLGPV
jgi:hypothetical protein